MLQHRALSITLSRAATPQSKIPLPGHENLTLLGSETSSVKFEDPFFRTLLEFEAFPSCSTKRVHGKKFSSDTAEQALAAGQLQGRPGIN